MFLSEKVYDLDCINPKNDSKYSVSHSIACKPSSSGIERMNILRFVKAFSIIFDLHDIFSEYCIAYVTTVIIEFNKYIPIEETESKTKINNLSSEDCGGYE